MAGKRVYLTSVFFYMAVTILNSQQIIPLQDTVQNGMIGIYLEKTGPARAFIDGKNYYPYYLNAKNIPLLRDEERRSARLTINGRSYDNLVLKYDTYTDDIIYTDDSLIYDNRVRQVALNKYKVSRFDLIFSYDTMFFRFFSKTIDSTFNLPEGFYELARSGKVTYLIRHRSYATKVAPGYNAASLRDYVYKPENYIRMENDFARITSRRQFTELFGEHSHEMNRYLKSRRINISKADKRQIIEVLKYYEKLD